jgi:hypothetical protein
VVPVPSMQVILDTALARASAPAQELFTAILAGPHRPAQRVRAVSLAKIVYHSEAILFAVAPAAA